MPRTSTDSMRGPRPVDPRSVPPPNPRRPSGPVESLQRGGRPTGGLAGGGRGYQPSYTGEYQQAQSGVFDPYSENANTLRQQGHAALLANGLSEEDAIAGADRKVGIFNDMFGARQQQSQTASPASPSFVPNTRYQNSNGGIQGLENVQFGDGDLTSLTPQESATMRNRFLYGQDSSPYGSPQSHQAQPQPRQQPRPAQQGGFSQSYYAKPQEMSGWANASPAGTGSRAFESRNTQGGMSQAQEQDGFGQSYFSGKQRAQPQQPIKKQPVFRFNGAL